ncbi:MAG: hypothetical protein V4558_08875 [Gemmatimonadota bacterium]
MAWKFPTVCCIALGFGGAGCSQPEEVPTSQLIDIVVDKSIDEDSLWTAAAKRAGLRVVLGSSEYQFGHAAASDGAELGVVDFGVLLGDGRAVISDFSKHRLVYLSPRGELLSLFGRRGEGPGEIGQAGGMYLQADGNLVFRDNQLQRATVLTPAENSLDLRRSYPVASYARPICALADVTVGVRYRPQVQRTIETRSLDGKRVNYIGLPLFKATNNLNVIATNGSLLCLPDKAQVVFAAQTGDLLAYRRDGSVAWRRKLADFVPSQVKEVGSGVLLTAAPPPLNRSVTVRALVRLDSITALLQMVMLVRRGEGKTSVVERSGIESRIIALEDGAELGRQTDLPLMLDVRDGMALTYAEEPEPMVGLVRLRLMPR